MQASIQTTNIFIDGFPLSKESNSKFLGVTIDEDLTWKQNIQNIDKAISRAISILFKLKRSFTKLYTRNAI